MTPGGLTHQRGMILLPVLLLAAGIAGIAGMAALSRHAATSEARIRIEKARALYLAHGGTSVALAVISGLAPETRPDGSVTAVSYAHGQAFYSILDTAAMLDVNLATKDELHQAFRAAGLDAPANLAAAIARSRSGNSRQPAWPLRTLDRLLLLPDISAEHLFGEPSMDPAAKEGTLAAAGKASPLVDLLTVHGGAVRQRDRKLDAASFLPGHAYRILALGRSGGASAMLWVTARKEPAHPAGVVVVHRRAL